MQTSAPPSKKSLKQKMEFTRLAFEFMRKHKSIAIGAVLFIFILFSAVLAPFFTGCDPLETNGIERLSPPSWDHLMGTDQLGRIS